MADNLGIQDSNKQGWHLTREAGVQLVPGGNAMLHQQPGHVVMHMLVQKVAKALLVCQHLPDSSILLGVMT
jgi:hypothetical protein